MKHEAEEEAGHLARHSKLTEGQQDSVVNYFFIFRKEEFLTTELNGVSGMIPLFFFSFKLYLSSIIMKLDIRYHTTLNTLCFLCG